MPLWSKLDLARLQEVSWSTRVTQKTQLNPKKSVQGRTITQTHRLWYYGPVTCLSSEDEADRLGLEPFECIVFGDVEYYLLNEQQANKQTKKQISQVCTIAVAVVIMTEG